MFSLSKPTQEMIESVLSRQSGQDFSYGFVGATRDPAATPEGYDCDHNRICLGKGGTVFSVACAALSRWQMFNLGWVKVLNADAPILTGTTVVVAARCYGSWWLNACRIVYVIDETGPGRKFGFAYGTLPYHVERGEERFTIEWDQADDSIWYDIYAFSQPAYWMVKLGYPLARRLQRRFAADSKRAMLGAVSDKSVQ
jgi:uncharacterized protein (UPF0548 family)